MMRRTGQNLLITGQPRAGKSTLARALLRRSFRAIVLDPLEDYSVIDPLTDAEIDDLDEALAFLAERYDTHFRLIYRHEGYPEIEYEALFGMVEHIQLRAAEQRLSVFLEEASVTMETHRIGANNRRLYNMGNRWGVNLVTIVQVDTDIHRVTRRNSQVIVAHRQHAVSGDMAKLFDSETLATLRVMTPADFTHGPPDPVQGVHFVTAPQDVNLYEWWEGLQ